MVPKPLKLASVFVISLSFCLSACAPSEPPAKISIESIQNQADARYQSGTYVEAGALYEDIANWEDAPNGRAAQPPIMPLAPTHLPRVAAIKR